MPTATAFRWPISLRLPKDRHPTEEEFLKELVASGLEIFPVRGELFVCEVGCEPGKHELSHVYAIIIELTEKGHTVTDASGVTRRAYHWAYVEAMWYGGWSIRSLIYFNSGMFEGREALTAALKELGHAQLILDLEEKLSKDCEPFKH